MFLQLRLAAVDAVELQRDEAHLIHHEPLELPGGIKGANFSPARAFLRVFPQAFTRRVFEHYKTVRRDPLTSLMPFSADAARCLRVNDR